MRRLAFSAFVICVFAGCDGKPTETIDFGKIESATHCSAGWDQSEATIVQCEQGSATLIGAPPIKFGVNGHVDCYSDGTKYFYWDGAKTMHRCE